MIELTNIPNIQFNAEKSLEELIEIIDIDSISKRKANLDHNPESPHRLGFNMLAYFKSGQGSHFVDFSKRQFCAGSVLFIRSNQIHAFDLSSHPEGKMILFTDKFFEFILSSIRTPISSIHLLIKEETPISVLSGSMQDSVDNLIVEMQKELSLRSSNLEIIVHLFVSLFLLLQRNKLQRHAKLTGKQLKQQLIVDHFITLVEAQFTSTRNAIDYAEQLSLSYKSLNTFCKSVTQLTAKQLIDRHTVLESKRRLVLESKSIQQLSNELGFDEETNFVKYFKKHTLLTPKQFRQSL